MLKLKKYNEKADFKKSGSNRDESVAFLQEQVLDSNITTFTA